VEESEEVKVQSAVALNHQSCYDHQSEREKERDGRQERESTESEECSNFERDVTIQEGKREKRRRGKYSAVKFRGH
jgi:hypothetical protein